MEKRADVRIKISANSAEMRELIANAMSSLSEREISTLKRLGVQIPDHAEKIHVKEFAKLLPYPRRVHLQQYKEISYCNPARPCENESNYFKLVAYKTFDYLPKINLAGEIECFEISCVEQYS